MHAQKPRSDLKTKLDETEGKGQIPEVTDVTPTLCKMFQYRSCISGSKLDLVWVAPKQILYKLFPNSYFWGNEDVWRYGYLVTLFNLALDGYAL